MLFLLSTFIDFCFDGSILACTNKKDFFPCKSSGVCVEKSLRCDGNPNCQDGEDEEDCNNQYFEKKIVKSYGTKKCISEMFKGKYFINNIKSQ